jgi:HAD superfamily hydrolase (TIGR01484 family)
MSEVNRKVHSVGNKSISQAAAHKLLASDLDGTLIPPAHVPGDGGVAVLRHALGRATDLTVAYVTGRSRALALEGIQLHELPPPQILVCDVGTSVFVAEGGDYVPDDGYRALMREALGGAEPGHARNLLAELEDLELQEDHSQTEFKLSYYTPADARGEELAALARELLGGVGTFNVVHSLDPHVRRGLLDVLPAGVAKDVAVRYLHDCSGVAEDALLYAGDSGNDLSAMLSGFRVVVVSNATDELKDTVRAQAEARGIAERVHFAEASYAAGVLEGCRRFGIV